MGEQRQRYNDEFKQQTVKFIQEQTKSVTEIAEELNIPAGTLHQ
ncbi:transposase, partial [Paenibacillus sp. 2RAB27]